VNLIYTDRFAQAACLLPKEARAKLPKALRLLAENPHHPGLQVKKMQGVTGGEIYEARLDLHFRFTFQLEGGLLILRNIDHHDDCLQDPY
jgi:hypothetical protein